MMSMRVMMVMNLRSNKFHLLVLFTYCKNICKRNYLIAENPGIVIPGFYILNSSLFFSK